MKGIKKGLAILLVLCTLLSMVVMTGAGTADTAQDAQPLAASGDSFMKMVLIDSGRGFVSVKNVKAIIDEMARCDYEYLMLGIGNDGLRFLLDDMSVTANDQTYYGENYGETIKNAIIAKNDELAPNAKGQWSEADMNAILTYAERKDISIVPLLNTPGHATSIVAAMTACGINAAVENRGNSTDTGSVTFDVMNSEAVAFMEAFVQKYITYFASKGCTYFNLGMDEFAGNHGGWSNMSDAEQTALGTYLSDLVGKLKTANMTPMAFCDVIGNMANVDNSVIGINWNGGYLSGHSNINANSNWYYVLGATGTGWAGYDKALAATASTSVTTPISGTANAGSLLAIWNDNYLAFDGYLDNVKTLIRTLAENNRDYFTVQQEETVDLVVGGSKSITVEGESYTGTYTPDPTGIANVSVNQTTIPGNTTYTRGDQVTSITSGEKYIIVNDRCDCALTDEITDTQYLALSDTPNSTTWEITKNGNKYAIKSDKGYLNIGDATASTGTSEVTLSLSYSSQYSCWTIAAGSYYLNQYGGTSARKAGGYTAGAGDAGSRWQIYKAVAVTTEPVEGTEITFTGLALGTTYVTVGNVRYTIKVTAEDLSQAPSLTYHPWISNYAISPEGTDAASCISSEGTARPVSIAATAEDVYREEGVEFSTLVPETGDWYYEGEGVQTYFWKGTVLAAGNHQNEGTNKSTDMSMRGTDFTYLRYWGGAWSYSSDRVNWTNVQDTDELCAYYLQKTTVTTEVDTYVKDWAFTTNNSDKSSSRYQKALSFAVVYPNGQLSPSTEKEIYSKSTLIYWDNLNPMTFIRIGTNGVYEIEKITYTFGERVNKSSDSVNWTRNDSINWEKTGTGTAEEWYDETVCWDENYGTEPVVNGADLQDAIYAGESPDDYTNYNGTWGANDAVLILIYLKPVVTEDSLIVRYYDDTANAEITNFAIQVANESTAEPKTFRNSLNPAFNGENANTVYPGGLQENAYVTNLNNINETIEQDLTKLSSLRGKYASGLYQYVGAEISADGKTLTLHYNLDSSKLSKNYVVDFGLPVEIPFADLVQETNTIQSVTIATPVNGTATIDDAKEVIRYAPERAYAGVVTLSVTVTFTDGPTQVFSVGITPATTVYYEEGFAVPYPADTVNVTTVGTAQNLTQTTSVVGSKAHYGYDAAYASAVGDSNGTAMKLAAGAGAATFTFTGTGVDIYTRSTMETGSLMIRVVDSNDDLVKVLSVNTVMKNGSTGATTGQAVKAYNVPIVSLSGLAHGTYTLQIAAVKSGSAGAKDVYLDGFRVYGTLDSAGNAYHDEGGVYYKDKEDHPTFIELRDRVLAGLNVNTSKSQYANQIAENVISQVHTVSDSSNGAVVLSKNDTFSDSTDVQDLLDNGPKNEIYLQPNQALTFKITTNREVQIGLKALNQATSYSINNGESVALNASTDMFYTVLNKAENETERTITITNNGTGILSITKLKVCDDPNTTLGELTAEDLIPALVSLGYETEPVEAEAVLNITVQAGDQTVTAQLTATGIEGESHTFTAAEIKAAAEAALPEGYTLDGVTFEDVTVVCGAQGETSYTAAAVQNPTPDQPTKVLQKLLAVIKNIFERLFRWL